MKTASRLLSLAALAAIAAAIVLGLSGRDHWRAAVICVILALAFFVAAEIVGRRFAAQERRGQK